MNAAGGILVCVSSRKLAPLVVTNFGSRAVVDGRLMLMGQRRRYRLRSNAVALPVWGWVVVSSALVAGVVGLVLAITGHGSVGALLMGLSGMVVGSSVIIERLNYYSSGRRDA